MAGKIVTNSVVLGDSATDTQNFCLKTNVDGTATFARGSAGNLGTVFGVNGSGVITGATITVAATAAPAFSAYRSSTSQSISSNTYVKVQLNTEDFDTNNNFDSTTNYRFTPTVAGYYQVNGSIVSDSSSSYGTGFFVVIYKNGTAYRTAGIQNTAAPTASIVSVSAVVYCNGTTDYIELYGYSIGGVGMALGTTYSSTAMSASLVRSA